MHLKWPEFWQLVKQDFDASFCAHVGLTGPCAGIRAQFVHGLRHAFTPLASYEHMAVVEDALKEKRDLLVVPLQAILATKVGALLYKGEGLAMRYNIFIKTVEERLDQLEDLGYASGDMESFKSVMTQEAKLMMESSPSFERKLCSLRYLGENMEVAILSVHDEWCFRLAARRNSQAISRLLVL